MVSISLFLGPALWCIGQALVDVPTIEITPGVHMPMLSIGTGGLEHNQSSEIVANWLKLGGRGIDTALFYKDQDTILPELAKAGVDRKNVFITTKIPGCDQPLERIELNLKQLGTDYIDLLLIHFPQGDCDQAWKVFEDYYRNGTVKAVGVSNYDKSQLEHLLTIATVHPAVNQVELNILEYDAEGIEFAKAHGIIVEAYSPLGRAGHSGDIPSHPVIKRIAASHNVSTYQVAMKWIVQHGHIATFQSVSAAHQASDADIFKFNLTDIEMSALDILGQGNSFNSHELHV